MRTDGMCDAEYIVSQSRNPKSEHGYDANTALHAMIAAALDAKDATIADLRQQVKRLTARVEDVTRIGQQFEKDARQHFDQSCANLNRATTAESELSRTREAIRVLGRWINRQRRGSRGVSYIEFQDDMRIMDSAVDCNALAAAAVKDPPTQHTPSVGA